LLLLSYPTGGSEETFEVNQADVTKLSKLLMN